MQRLLVQSRSHGKAETRFRYNFIWFIFFFFLVFGIIQSLRNIFLDELFVLFRIRFGHLIEHFPYVVGHAKIFLIGEAEHILQLLRNHRCNYEIGCQIQDNQSMKVALVLYYVEGEGHCCYYR